MPLWLQLFFISTENRCCIEKERNVKMLSVSSKHMNFYAASAYNMLKKRKKSNIHKHKKQHCHLALYSAHQSPSIQIFCASMYIAGARVYLWTKWCFTSMLVAVEIVKKKKIKQRSESLLK